MNHKDSETISDLRVWLGSGAINIFGPPFSGKDTQVKALAKKLGAPVIAGGEILRSHPDRQKIKKLMVTGKLFPTDFYLSIMLPYLSKPEFTGRLLILNSVGRWHGEEKVIMKAAKESGHPIKAVVFLNITEDAVRHRYKTSQNTNDRGNRLDDTEHLISVRLSEFQAKTLPVINYYRAQGLLIAVDGSRAKQEVTDLIIGELHRLAKGLTRL